MLYLYKILIFALFGIHLSLFRLKIQLGALVPPAGFSFINSPGVSGF